LGTVVAARSRPGPGRVWKIAALGLLLGSAALPSAALDPARPAATAAVSPSGPLTYWIELLEAPVGPGPEVTERRIFHSGEKIRLHVRSTRDGFVSLVQVASSGALNVLVPRSPKSTPADTRVRANEDRVLPADTYWFAFDDTPRTERLLLLFRPTQQAFDNVLELAKRPGQRDLPDAVQIELKHR